MAGINRDMDTYLRRRKGGSYFTFPAPSRSPASNGSSWWSGIFSGSAKQEDEELDQAERAELTAMETDIEAREAEIEHIQEFEEELEEQQEREVSLYHKLRRWFGRSPTHEDDDVALDAMPSDAEMLHAQNAPDVTNDFRELAQIQMRWLGRMPSRVMQEFKESDDFHKLTEILERRGVARRKT